jgi:hypothetical protein
VFLNDLQVRAPSVAEIPDQEITLQLLKDATKIDDSFRGALGGSSRCEIVYWPELRNNREKKERDEMMIGT